MLSLRERTADLFRSIQVTIKGLKLLAGDRTDEDIKSFLAATWALQIFINVREADKVHLDTNFCTQGRSKAVPVDLLMSKYNSK
jgi:hypothetical protein